MQGLCRSCMNGSQALLDLPEPSSQTDLGTLPGKWVKRSIAHDIEHQVAQVLRGMMIVTSCGQRMSTLAVVPASSDSESIYRCGVCSDLAENSENR